MNSSCLIDDKDLDDAALWAVIESAEASRSASSKQLVAVKRRNFHSPISKPSPQQQSMDNQSSKYNSKAISPYSDPYQSRPNKMARSCISDMSESTSPLALVRTPIATNAVYSSPEAYLSPKIRRYIVNDFGDDRSDVSPGSCVRQHSEENELTRHCLNLKFPSVSLFKDYQNAAMEILEKSDYIMISGHPFIKKSVVFDFLLLEVEGSQTVGGHVKGARSGFQNLTMTSLAQQKLELRTELAR
ncbi:hypothetical protein LINPERPRIM_LOCUS26171 [Linum perenne]